MNKYTFSCLDCPIDELCCVVKVLHEVLLRMVGYSNEMIPEGIGKGCRSCTKTISYIKLDNQLENLLPVVRTLTIELTFRFCKSAFCKATRR